MLQAVSYPKYPRKPNTKECPFPAGEISKQDWISRSIFKRPFSGSVHCPSTRRIAPEPSRWEQTLRWRSSPQVKLTLLWSTETLKTGWKQMKELRTSWAGPLIDSSKPTLSFPRKSRKARKTRKGSTVSIARVWVTMEIRDDKACAISPSIGHNLPEKLGKPIRPQLRGHGHVAPKALRPDPGRVRWLPEPG